MTDLISIIIPVYNVEKYLERCVNSILKQTYKNTEIIVIDDGSTDKSGKVADNLSLTDKRIKVIHKDNGGVSSARNYGISIATGTLICFVDADDYVENDYLACLLKYQKIDNYDIVISNAKDFNNNCVIDCSNRLNEPITLNRETTILEFFKGKLFTSVCWGNLYKTELIKNIVFDKNMRIGEDGKFLLNAIEKSNNNLVIPERKYLYYIRNGSAVHSGFSKKYYDEIAFCEETLKKYENNNKYNYYINQKYFYLLLRILEFKDLPFEDYGIVRNRLINLNFKASKKIKLKALILSNYILRKCYLYFRR